MLRLIQLSVQVIYFVIIDGRTYRTDYLYYHEASGWMKMHTTPAHWRDARVTCVEEGAILASPTTKKMAAAMMTVIMTTVQPPPYVYTGIHDTYFKGLFYSVEGIPIQEMYSKWASGEPDNVDSPENCITMFRNGLLHDNTCEELFPFICYKRELISGTNRCGTEDMSYRFDPRTESCYKFHVMPETWSKAFATCSREGGHLVVINSDEEAQVVKELFAFSKVPDVAHAGFTDSGNQSSTTTWITIHGQGLLEAGYERWADGEPQLVGTHCGAVFDDGFLDDYYCDVELPFICEMKVPIRNMI